MGIYVIILGIVSFVCGFFADFDVAMVIGWVCLGILILTQLVSAFNQGRGGLLGAIFCFLFSVGIPILLTILVLHYAFHYPVFENFSQTLFFSGLPMGAMGIVGWVISRSL